MPPWPDIAGDFPAPRDDEPSSLRQDIADELADHLSSAFQRELHFARDETAAKEKVLDRFGDPRKIARKLWLDAMQEKIMSQRMTFVALLVVVVASLGSTGLTWFLIDQARQVNQAMLDQSREANAALLQQSQQLLSQSHDSNRALVEQGQKANEALLSKLGQLSTGGRESAEPPKSLEWNQVKVRLYAGEKPGKPAAGYEVILSGYILDTAKEVEIRRKTDAQGIADLGLIRPGQHKLFILTPWSENRTQSRVTVLPGQALLEEIACPAAEPALADVAFTVGWPDDLKDKGMWLVCHFDREPRDVGGAEWKTPIRLRERVVLISPDGQAVPFPMGNPGEGPPGMNVPAWPFGRSFNSDEVRGLHVDRIEQEARRARFSAFVEERQKAGQASRKLPWIEESLFHSIPYLFAFREVPHLSAVRWPSGRYRLHDILAANDPSPLSLQAAKELTRSQGPRAPSDSAPEAEATTDLRKMRVFGGLVSGQSNRQQQQHPGMQRFDPLQDWFDLDAIQGIRQSDQILQELRKKEQPEFVAEADATNRWTIPLPSRLLERVRNYPAFQPAETEAAAPAKLSE